MSQKKRALYLSSIFSDKNPFIYLPSLIKHQQSGKIFVFPCRKKGTKVGDQSWLILKKNRLKNTWWDSEKAVTRAIREKKEKVGLLGGGQLQRMDNWFQTCKLEKSV